MLACFCHICKRKKLLEKVFVLLKAPFIETIKILMTFFVLKGIVA
jgi:hypothetical protein